MLLQLELLCAKASLQLELLCLGRQARGLVYNPRCFSTSQRRIIVAYAADVSLGDDGQDYWSLGATSC